MKNSTKRFAFHSTLLTAGVAFIVLGVPVLSAYGLGLFLLSFGYSGYRKSKIPSLWGLLVLTALCGICFVWYLARRDAFINSPVPIWLAIGFAAIWAFDLIFEFRRWRINRRLTHDA
jgi:hypothetical protein